MDNEADDRRVGAQRIGDANGIAHIRRALDHAQRTTAAALSVELRHGELDAVVDRLQARALGIQRDTDADFRAGR